MSQKRKKKPFKPKIKNKTMEHTLSGERSPIMINQNAFGIQEMRKKNSKVIFNDDDWRRLQEYVNAQCNAEEICSFFNICEDTLLRIVKEKYDMTTSEYITINKASGKASLRRRLYDIAFSNEQGNVTAAIWLSKNILDMSDKKQLEISAQKPIQFAYCLNEESEID